MSALILLLLIASFAVDLQVEHIRKVEWNKEAFTSLVADDDTKELVTALVTNQLAAERATDLMSGKGAGENNASSVRTLKLIIIFRLDYSTPWVGAHLQKGSIFANRKQWARNRKSKVSGTVPTNALTIHRIDSHC